MDLQQIRLLIQQEMAAVETMIATQLQSKTTLINQISDYMVHAGGKRLRPMLAVLAAKALNGTQQHAVIAATFIEFIHTATLLHDDVVDGSERRHGKATAHTLFGNAASILVGDFIYTRAFQMMMRLRSLPMLQLMADTTNSIAEGEVMQLMHCHDPELTEADYLQVIYHKTACLFEAAAQSGALVAQASPTQQQGLKEYGGHLGMAFQLIDDLLDYCAEPHELGKNLGDDLNEGKLTLPLLHAIHHGKPAQSAMIRQIVLQGFSRPGDERKLDEVLAIMRHCNSFHYVRQRAEEEIAKAIAALQALPDNAYRQALVALAKGVTQRGND